MERILVICINNEEAEELNVSQVYEAKLIPELDDFYLIGLQPYEKKRFSLFEKQSD